MANDKIQYALEKGTELHSSSKKLLGIPTGEERVYTIEKTLGQGGFGITYLATRKIGNIPQKFAIKEFFVKGQCWRQAGNPRMMFPEAVEAKQDVKEWLHEFEKEAELLNEICQRTPNIVQVNEVFRANDTAYYVMEYLEGGSLRDIVKEGGLPEDIALSYILPVVKAVHMLHTMKQPLLHCDIKHDNIMLRKHVDGVIDPVLIDFGESRHFKENGNLTTTHIATGGSRGFEPMEQYLGITTFIPQVDVYALAATLYYIVTGDEPPFAGDVTEELIRRKLPVSLSDSLKDAIVHGMQKDKDKRTCDTRTFYNEVSGKDIGDVKPKTIVSPELPIGYSLKNKGKLYEIVSVISRESYYIRYRVTCANEGVISAHGQTRRAQFDIYEYFDKKNNRRQEDKSVIADGNTEASKKQFLSLCKKITKGEINGEFSKDSNLGWVTFSSNNTLYLVDTHYSPPLTWKKILTYAGVGIGSAFFVVGAINIYNSIKEANIKERLEMSQRLTDAIATNNAEVLQEFAEKHDSARAYLPYALICFNNGDFDTAELFANNTLKSIIEQKIHSLTQDRTRQEAQQLLADIDRAKEKYDSLFNVAKLQYGNGRLEEAKITLSKIDDEYSSKIEVRELIGKIENELKEMKYTDYLSKAKSAYEKKKSSEALSYISKIKKELGQAYSSKKEVRDLEKKINEIIPSTNDELFAKAKTISDYRALADKGYSMAYAPLAELYLNQATSQTDYDNAHQFATKAINANVGKEQAVKVVESLEKKGYYEFGIHTKPNY